MRQMFLNLVNKMSEQEGKRRVNILRAIKFQLRKRFMKLYRLFRHKKYGEPIVPLVIYENVD